MGTESVLVVDDHRTNRLKMAAAVRNLGYVAEVASGGQEALDILRARSCDAVLLDIVMPGMDGFDVLRALKEDEALRDVPVIVVSALDDDTASVVRAIELGAEDFLPKDFDPVILRARLGASLQKKRFRDQEREFRRLVGKLTEAAATLESGSFRPERLAIDDVAGRDDPLGRLARVFKSMAEEIYERERRLRRNVRTARGSLLVLAVGASWGILAPLSRMASGLESDPLGLAVWVNLIGAVICLGVAAARNRLPKLTWPVLRFSLFGGILTGVLEKLLLFWVTGHVQATTVSLMVTLEGFMVFAVAAAMGLEKASLRRLGGLLLGLVGAVLVILTRESLVGGDGLFWLLMALGLPLLFTVEDILAVRRPEGMDATAATGLMMLVSFALVSARRRRLGRSASPRPGRWPARDRHLPDRGCERTRDGALALPGERGRRGLCQPGRLFHHHCRHRVEHAAPGRAPAAVRLGRPGPDVAGSLPRRAAGEHRRRRISPPGPPAAPRR